MSGLLERLRATARHIEQERQKLLDACISADSWPRVIRESVGHIEALERERDDARPWADERLAVILNAAKQLWYLAAGLHDDDSYFGEERGAPGMLLRTGEMIGWDELGANSREWFKDVVGETVEEALAASNAEKERG